MPLQTSVSLPHATHLIMDRLQLAIAARMKGFQHSRQTILRASLLIGALLPPSTRDTVTRRETVTGEPLARTMALSMDPIHFHALQVLHPCWFRSQSRALEWAVQTHEYAILQYITDTFPADQYAIRALVMALPLPTAYPFGPTP